MKDFRIVKVGPPGEEEEKKIYLGSDIEYKHTTKGGVKRKKGKIDNLNPDDEFFQGFIYVDDGKGKGIDVISSEDIIEVF